MRQMPSVTEITVPSVRFSADTWRFWIFVLISSLISEGLICMGLAPGAALACERGGHLAEGVAHGSVDDLVADLHAGPAEELGIHVQLGLDLLAVAALERRDDRVALRVGERLRARDARLEDALVLVLEGIELRGDLADQLLA